MGDAPDAGVFALLFPGVLFPFLYLLKLVLSKLFFRNVQALSMRRILISSGIESIGPPISLLAGGALLAIFPDERWIRIGSFFMALLVINCVVNLRVLLLGRNPVDNTAKGFGIAVLLGGSATALFPAIWVGLGHLLLALH